MFTLTITPRVGNMRVESFATQADMDSAYTTYIRCGIAVTASVTPNLVPMGTAKWSL